MEVLKDKSQELAEARRNMRRLLLALGPDGIDLLDAYYKAITLSEHEAMRRDRRPDAYRERA